MERIYTFDPEKNKKLIEFRGISFEEIIVVLESEGALDVVDHYNDIQYGHQKIFLVKVKNYVYFVPFVGEGNKVFLKTIFPHRKATRKYLK